MKTNLLFVIIPAHNRREITRRCLESLEQQTLSGFSVVVVDDGSTDGTSEMIHENFLNVTVLQGDGNLWWTGGTNKGVEYALEQGAELIVTLNDDVIVDDDYLAKFIEVHRKYPKALVGSLNLSKEDPPQLLYAGIISLNSWTAKCVKRGNILTPYTGKLHGLMPTRSLPGRGTLIPRTVFERIGLFDEKCFRHYAADQDFSLRAKLAGFDLLINTDSPVYSPYESGRTGGDSQSFLSFLRSFVSVRSCNYLPVLIRYNYRHHPYKIYFPVFMIIDLGRRVFSFFRMKMRQQ